MSNIFSTYRELTVVLQNSGVVVQVGPRHVPSKII